MSPTSPRAGRRFGRGWSLAFGLPLAGAIGWCLLLRPSVQAVLAPVFGPWAGVLFGHRDCTLAHGAELACLAILTHGVATLAGAWRVRRSAWHAVLLALGAAWALVWEASALLSVANTLA